MSRPRSLHEPVALGEPETKSFIANQEPIWEPKTYGGHYRRP